MPQLLSDYLAKYPFVVTIPASFGNRATIRHEWLATLHDGYKKPVIGSYGWLYGAGTASIYRNGGGPWRYLFKDERAAVEFKLRFG